MVPIITLTTDFGVMDGYVASMKGVILGICPAAHLVDVTHLIGHGKIRSAAYILKTITPYFPYGTVHLAVVDPGVGSERKAIAIQTDAHLFIGPDNGLFSFVLRNNPPLHVHSIENPQFVLSSTSSTFHGRDIFAPAAAHLALGLSILELGPPCPFTQPDWSSVRVEQDRIWGEIIHIDRFGNCITNVERHHIQGVFGEHEMGLKVGDLTISGLSKTYSDVPVGTPLVLIGSSGHLEVAVNGGGAASILDKSDKHVISIFRVKK